MSIPPEAPLPNLLEERIREVRGTMKCPRYLYLVIPAAVLAFWIAVRVIAWRVHYGLALTHTTTQAASAEAWRETLVLGGWAAMLCGTLAVAIHFLVVRQIDRLMGKASDATAVAAREVLDIRAALAAHSIVTITDAAGEITFVNDKFCEISKYSRGELLGQDHRIVNSGYHPESFFAGLWKTISSGEVWKGEIRNRAKDGGHYWVDTTIFPFLGRDGKPYQYVAIRTDITQRKEDELRLKFLAEELAEKNKELETIVYVVSHDLRSPLLNVQGFGNALARSCDVLREKLGHSSEPAIEQQLKTEMPRAIRFVQSSISKMEALLNGFLRFSRIGRMDIQLQPLSMRSIMAGAIQALKFQSGEAGATIEVGDLPDCVGDTILAGQVFSNLLDNALKYRDPERACHISIAGRVENGESIYSVRDNGLGIAPEQQSKVFELFHRVDPKKTSGEGIGLAIVQRMVLRQTGRIWVESKFGEGSTFFVALPHAA